LVRTISVDFAVNAQFRKILPDFYAFLFVFYIFTNCLNFSGFMQNVLKNILIFSKFLTFYAIINKANAIINKANITKGAIQLSRSGILPKR